MTLYFRSIRSCTDFFFHFHIYVPFLDINSTNRRVFPLLPLSTTISFTLLPTIAEKKQYIVETKRANWSHLCNTQELRTFNALLTHSSMLSFAPFRSSVSNDFRILGDCRHRSEVFGTLTFLISLHSSVQPYITISEITTTWDLRENFLHNSAPIYACHFFARRWPLC